MSDYRERRLDKFLESKRGGLITEGGLFEGGGKVNKRVKV